MLVLISCREMARTLAMVCTTTLFRSSRSAHPSAVDCTLGCGTLRYLVLTDQPAVFNINCVTNLITSRNTGIHPVMPDQSPTAAILSELVRTHKHEVRPFNAHQRESQREKLERYFLGYVS